MGDLRNAKSFILSCLVLPRSPSPCRSTHPSPRPTLLFSTRRRRPRIISSVHFPSNTPPYSVRSSHHLLRLRAPFIRSPEQPAPVDKRNRRVSAADHNNKQKLQPNVPKILSLTNTLPTVTKRSCSHCCNTDACPARAQCRLHWRNPLAGTDFKRSSATAIQRTDETGLTFEPVPERIMIWRRVRPPLCFPHVPRLFQPPRPCNHHDPHNTHPSQVTRWPPV